MKEKNINQIKMYISKTLSHPMNHQTLFFLYYQIGKYLFQHKFETHELKILEWELKKTYGIIIGFTKRNFIYMMQFYSMYPTIKAFQNITWYQCVSLLRIKDYEKKQERYETYVKANQLKKTEDYLLLEMQQLQKNRM